MNTNENRQPSVLIVEGNVRQRLQISTQLNHAGFRVWTACNGAQANALLLSGLSVSALLISQMLPGPTSSAHVAMTARQHLPKAAILFNSHDRSTEPHNTLSTFGRVIPRSQQPATAVLSTLEQEKLPQGMLA